MPDVIYTEALLHKAKNTVLKVGLFSCVMCILVQMIDVYK